MRHSGGVSEALRVAILAGGWSHARAASLETGRKAADTLRKSGIEVLLLDPAKDLVRLTAQLVSARADIILNCLQMDEDEKPLLGALLLFGTTVMHDVEGILAQAKVRA